MGTTSSIDTVQRQAVVALVGNPNTGKTTLFNVLTGYRQRVGNYPGVTVEKKSGRLRLAENARSVEVIDLPGAYSLAANSEDEAVVLDVLLGQVSGAPIPDVFVVVLDATSLTRNLFLASQLAEIGKPMVCALNMVDLAEAAGLSIDCGRLAAELGVPVVPVVATKGTGIETLKSAIVASLDGKPAADCTAFPDCVRTELEGLDRNLNNGSSNGAAWVSRVELQQILLDPGGHHERRLVQRRGPAVQADLAQRRQRIHDAGESLAEVEAQVRYQRIGEICRKVVTRIHPERRSASELADRFLTHRVFGPVVLLVILALCFQAIYTWALPIMDAVDGAILALGGMVSTFLPEGAVQSMIVDGAIAGVGAVLVFLPQILILFLFLAILEDCGYMARAAFLLDRWMGYLGLSGKSLIPLVSSFACAVPGIMATRVIEDRRDRFVTILIAPLMSCSARLPVYLLLIAAFVPAVPLLGGWIGLQAVTLLAMYAVGTVIAIILAFILKRTILRGKPQPFLMELPAYRWPSVRTVVYRMYEQGKVFCVSAGTVIFAVTMIIWAMGYYPKSTTVAAEHETRRQAMEQAHMTRLGEIAKAFPQAAGLTAASIAEHPQILSVVNAIERVEAAFSQRAELEGLREGTVAWRPARDNADEQLAAIVASEGDTGRAALALYRARVDRAEQTAAIDRSEAGAALRYSLLGRMGTWIEPVVEPLGWDWRIGTAAIASFPAREVVIATLGTIFNLGGEEDESSVSLREKLHTVTWPDGRPLFNVAVALSIMVFFALCCQCGATLATIYRETKSWRWPAFTFVYMTGLAYLGAFITYHVAVRFV